MNMYIIAVNEKQYNVTGPSLYGRFILLQHAIAAALNNIYDWFIT